MRSDFSLNSYPGVDARGLYVFRYFFNRGIFTFLLDTAVRTVCSYCFPSTFNIYLASNSSDFFTISPSFTDPFYYSSNKTSVVAKTPDYFAVERICMVVVDLAGTHLNSYIFTVSLGNTSGLFVQKSRCTYCSYISPSTFKIWRV